jgi:hypothetical protein
VSVNVASVYNRFFGGGITVTGLLTGVDIVDHIRSMGAEAGAAVVIPQVALRAPEYNIFLDEMTVDQVQEATGRQVVVTERLPKAIAAAVLGLETV